ncbi:MAG: MBL fold metallo-hydrolase [Cyanobacteria bacterium J06635_15]
MPDSDTPSIHQPVDGQGDSTIPASTTTITATHPASSFTVQFWGVRGSIPTPGADTVRYGGNTACVEILVGDQRLIFDGGTGLRVLGKHLLNHHQTISAHLFFTHTHWDRIQGFPFFNPAFVAGNCFEIYGATAPNGASIKQCLTDQMLRPNFPTPLQEMRSQMQFHNLAAGSVIPIEDVLIETISLNRFTSALGFRVTWQGYSLVYATDTDHSIEGGNQNLIYLAQQADLLIYDGSYADRIYPDIKPQAELDSPSWYAGVEMAKDAGVRELIMFHHHPAHDDDALDRLEMEMRSHFPRARLAREGMILQIA